MAGTYFIRVHHEGGYYYPADFRYPGDDEASGINLGNASTTAGVDIALAELSKITGRITAEDGITPLEGIVIRTFHLDDGSWEGGEDFYSDSNGNYVLRGLAANTYRVSFSDDDRRYQQEYYNNAPSLQNAEDIVLGTSVTVGGINASLAPLSRITGKVLASDGITPLRYAGVSAMLWDAESEGWANMAGASTKEDGTYDLRVQSGTYRIAFSVYDGKHMGEYYNDSSSLETADDIVVGNNVTISGINAVLGEKSKIKGTVTGPDGLTPLQGIQVRAYFWNDFDENWYHAATTYSDLQGAYTLAGLSPGRFAVRFSDPDGRHETEFYDNASSLAEATTFEVGVSSVVSGINISLARSSTITGTVAADDGSGPLSDIGVTLFRRNGNSLGWDDFRYTLTRPDGSYSFNGLSPGTYRLRFADRNRIYQYEYHRDSRDLDSSADIPLAAGTQIMVNASLASAATVTPQVMSIRSGNGNSLILQLYGGTGRSYQLQGSTNLTDWEDIEDPVTCDYELLSIPVSSSGKKQFWRFKSVP